MQWKDDWLNLGEKKSLPSLLDSVSIDSEVKSRRTAEDEIVVGAELESPVAILSSNFPHILARIVEFWGKDQDFDDYMESVLLIDRRERQGLPRPVLNSLMEVWNDHRVRKTSDSSDKKESINAYKSAQPCDWESDPHFHKSFKKLEQENEFIRRHGLSGAEAALLDRRLTERANIKHAKEDLLVSGKPMRLEKSESNDLGIQGPGSFNLD